MKVQYPNYTGSLKEQNKKKEKYQLVCIANIQTGNVLRISKNKAYKKVSKFNISSKKQGNKWLYTSKEVYKRFKKGLAPQLITEVLDKKDSHFENKGTYYSIINCYVGFGSIRKYKRPEQTKSSTKVGGKGVGYQYIYGEDWDKKYASFQQLNMIKHINNPKHQSNGLSIAKNVNRIIKPVKTIRYEK